MSDPKRLLSADSDADELERALLDSLRVDAPSERERAAIWQHVSAGVTAAGIVGASAGVAASSTGGASAALSGAAAKSTASSVAGGALSKTLLVKGALLLALGAAGTGGVVLYRAHDAAPAAKTKRAQAPAARPASAPAKADFPGESAPEAPPAASTPAARPRDARAKHVAPDRLARESALLTEARAALRSGDLTRAEATLARLERAFPSGVLSQESEVLAIELLLKRDRDAEARARAARFVAQHPESPHSTRLERLLR